MLKGLGEAMGENLTQQDVLLTEIDSKVLLFILRTTHNLSQNSSCINNDGAADGCGKQRTEDEQYEAKGACDPGCRSLPFEWHCSLPI